MPKRAKTPPIDDGAKYLTIVGPYPAHPNMELEQHRREFSRWLASCTGSSYLRAFYHKPTSPGSVIVEVDESFPDFKRVLGEHKWGEFLVEPKDEGGFVSKVFYCTYNSDRDVQKNGWKRVDIEEKWFKTKAPSKFVSPYPPTYWCNVPPEKNPIHNPLSRPLPHDDFPPPPLEPSPVVGTVEWQAWKQRQKAPRVVTSWTRGALQSQVPAVTTPTTTSSTPVSRATSSRGSSSPHTVPVQAWKRATAPLSPPGLPPGLTRGESSSGLSQRSAGSAWGEPSSRRSTSPLGGPPSSGTTSSDDVPPATSADGALKDVKVAEQQIVDPFAALSMNDYEDDVYYSIDGGSAAGDFAGLEADGDVMYFPRADAVFVTEDSNVQGGEGEEEDDVEDDDEDTTQNPLLCPEHNIVCRKGICKVYAARKREEERKKRREEREKEREQAKAKRENKVKKGKNLTEPSSVPSGISTPGSSSARSPPPHLRLGVPAPAARAPPPHLKAGAPLPRPSSTRALPPHLQRGASASSGPTAPPPPGHQGGRATPTQEDAAQDDARSESSWGNPSEGPWGPTTNPGWNRMPSAPATRPSASASRPTPAVAAAPTPARQPVWGKAPSISASSVRRNYDSWSVSAHSARNGKDGANASNAQRPQQQKQKQQQQWGAWGGAPSISASSVRRNNDSWSVSARSAAVKDGDGDDARSVDSNDTSGWGRPPSVVGARRTWADEMDDEDGMAVHARAAEDDDVRSVAASTESGWGNPSAGPW